MNKPLMGLFSFLYAIAYAINSLSLEFVTQGTFLTSTPITNGRVATLPPQRTPKGGGGGAISWGCSYSRTSFLGHTHIFSVCNFRTLFSNKF
jgi:hypothetical protein